MKKITLPKSSFFLIVLLTLVSFIGYSQTTVTLSTGTSWTVPAGVTSITVEAWGGGGKGGTRTTNGNGGGGGGGAYAKKIITVTAGNSYNYSVGAGSTTTSAGGDSWFLDNTTVLAKGGNSVANNSASGASGGAGNPTSIGDAGFVFAGGNGATGSAAFGGGGGSSAGTINPSNGVNATNATGATATDGGAGGKGGDGRSTSQGNGTVGSIPGGGGGGAYRTSSGTQNGGNGGNGQIRITYTLPEINIQGNSANINDNATTTTATNGTIIGPGTTSIGSSISRTYTIQNTGLGILTIGTITLSNTAEFAVTTPPSTTVAAGGTTTFTVTFSPIGFGQRFTTISIENNDPNENPYNFVIQGVAVGPEINVIGNNLEKTVKLTTHFQCKLTTSFGAN
ncbi:choice-of-anchor D domain-containing protein [Flavobacterium sp.]|jgi:hypothetical protein|uniref:glycine-rich domain-containing protein n=1 Tax=Flavobacterium sp. TaxID=239 RepID=UPI0037C04B14